MNTAFTLVVFIIFMVSLFSGQKRKKPAVSVQADRPLRQAKQETQEMVLRRSLDMLRKQGVDVLFERAADKPAAVISNPTEAPSIIDERNRVHNSFLAWAANCERITNLHKADWERRKAAALVG